jgi:putative transposase
MKISEVSIYRWKKKFAGMGGWELRRLKQLDDENRRLKRLLAELTLDKHRCFSMCSQKALKPPARIKLATF